jgi:hypothetical protein
VGRRKGSGQTGPTRSVRLPRALDDWFATRLDLKPEASPSEVLVALIHGGLRLRDGYMAVHRRALEHYLATGQIEPLRVYRRCLLDSCGSDYVGPLARWLAADGLTLGALDGASVST